MGAKTMWSAAALVGSVAVTVASLAAASGDLRVVDAVKRQDQAKVRALLQQRVDVNASEGDGSTALHWAAHQNDTGMADLLIRAGARVNAATAFGVTPLWLASENRSLTMVEKLLEAGANPNAALTTGETALMRAAWTGSLDVAKALLARGADVNAKESVQDQTALMWATTEKHPDVVRFLIDNRADVHARSKTGFTPLMFAARSGDVESARMLLAAGANVNDTAVAEKPRVRGGEQAQAPSPSTEEPKGMSALLVATVRGHVEFAKLLLEKGADANAAGPGYTPLHWAAGSWETYITGVDRHIAPPPDHEWNSIGGLRTGKMELVKALLAHGANPNGQLVREPPRIGYTRSLLEGRKWIGATAFVLAARSCDASVMRALVEGGADPRLPTKEGITPLMAAAGMGRIISENFCTETENATLEAVNVALETGNNVNAVDETGETALHAAAHIRSNALVQLLVNKGAQIDAKNKKGETPQMIAERLLQFFGANVIERTSTGELLRKLGGSQQ